MRKVVIELNGNEVVEVEDVVDVVEHEAVYGRKLKRHGQALAYPLLQSPRIELHLGSKPGPAVVRALRGGRFLQVTVDGGEELYEARIHVQSEPAIVVVEWAAS
jgi:hypothetical protein